MNDTSRHPRVPFIRRAKAMAAVAVVANTAVLASAASPALADPLPVRQGQTITISDCFETEFTVIPPDAGTTAVVQTVLPTTCRIDFTASSTYLGLVTVSSVVDTYQLEVTNKNASIGATFTPKAAPGPCIQIVSGANIDFGDVTIGGTLIGPNTKTNVQSCAQINMKINAKVSAATSGVAPNVLTMQPIVNVSPLPPNTFLYTLTSYFPSCIASKIELQSYELDTVGMRPFTASAPAECPIPILGSPEPPLTPGITREYSHGFSLGAGSSGVGQAFSTTVTLTALAA